MNKETRTFILGLIFLFIGAIGLIQHIINLINHTFIFDTLNYLFIISSIGLSIMGWIKIKQTTN